MSCNFQIHEELKNMMESTCPFCDRLLVEFHKVVESCCSEQDIETVNGMNICVNCGLVHGYDFTTEYVDFYDNMHRIRKKSVYNRKYRIENVLNDLVFKNGIQMTKNQIDKIYKVFIEINSVLYKVNDGRKRMISIKYIIKQLFKMIGLPYKDINVTKCKRTLKYYKQRCEKIESLIGDKIQSIINK